MVSGGFWCPRRPALFDERTLDTALEYAAPQSEAVASPIGKPNEERPLAGFGPIARWWSSRLPFAGTYDDAWLEKHRDELARGLPSDYAADFDPRFFQCAHSALTTEEHLTGDEEVVLAGLAPGGEELDSCCRELSSRLCSSIDRIALVELVPLAPCWTLCTWISTR
jgi:hypothetical protein